MHSHILLFDKPLQEHHNSMEGEDISSVELLLKSIEFKNNPQKICVKVDRDKQRIYSSYFIGVDWIHFESKTYLYVEPKLNNTHRNVQTQINYLGMLFSALKHSGVAPYTKDLYHIKFDLPEIEITQSQDLLTPLLVVQFLSLIKEIVRKGLKKSYYKVEKNLYGKIKGKVLVGQTIKQNVLKNKPINTLCSYEEFGFNGLENRLLKKALVFVQRYLPSIKNLKATAYTTDVFNYVNPAFEGVSEDVNLNEIKHIKINVFYKEYSEAIRLAKLILKRFGYNINSTQQKTIKTPPFWIDMSKLFELYVLGLLKDKFFGQILYGDMATGNYGLPDFLLAKKDEEKIIDAKYKRYYKSDFFSLSNDLRDIVASDIRQLSGYARDKKILLNRLKVSENKILDCLIIYPDQEISTENIKKLDFENEITPISQFNRFYKLAIKLPEISTS